jgi:hypothetical protein
VNVDIREVDEAAGVYVRALEILPDDIERGFAMLHERETRATARSVPGTMVKNIHVAEQTAKIIRERELQVNEPPPPSAVLWVMGSGRRRINSMRTRK